ncbi:protein DpdE [Saccharothrix sp. NRRL B-16348]|uniref:protein DpdE n=1 Tax=Saccharothrix sp. NRRL B-16348 TaxID=1415542 RepID=UPI000AB3EAF3|nr:protein DpdE [Saccharothrix sp. NRRL B-16348]
MEGTIRFFDSPTTPEVVLGAEGRSFKAEYLPSQERVWWFDGERWMVGRVDSPCTPKADEYYVHFPNGDTRPVPSAELKVRWSLPVGNPLALLRAGTVETRFLHLHRTAFLRGVTEQRSACGGLGGLLSSAVEIHDHQIGAARRVLSDPVPRYLLADEVGLGKTIQAGMVLRQFLLDAEGVAVVIVPDQIVGQWEAELSRKFRIGQFPDRVSVIGHSRIYDIQPVDRLLTIVDEAHRFTDHVDYSTDSDRGRRYEALRAIAHASRALLLLSATPVRSNEDAFLGLLHLLDPTNYLLTDVHAFKRRVEMRDELAQAMSAVSAETPLRYLDEPLGQVAQLLAEDPVVERLVVEARKYATAKRQEETRNLVERLRIHVSETYRLHRRMIRNRRASAVKKAFPVRGRGFGNPWRIPDPDPRRREVFSVFEDLRLELELLEHPGAGRVLRAVLGRILAPVVALEDLVVALRGGTEHDLSPDEGAAVAELRELKLADHMAGELERLALADVETDRIAAAVEWASRRIGRGKCAIACSHPNTARSTARQLVEAFGRYRVTALLEEQDEDERNRLTTEFERSGERNVLVIDRSAEEGVNLQFVDEVLHLDIPASSARLEQRLGRFDRWSELKNPVRSVVFGEADPTLDEQLGAWTMTLIDVFSAFTASTSTLQYVLADLEVEFFDLAVTRNLAGAMKAIADSVDTLEEQRQRIAAQDLLDSIEDRADDEELAERLASVDSRQKDIEKSVVGYVHDMLAFKVDHDETEIRFAAGEKQPPLLTKAALRALGTQIFAQPYTADRMEAAEGRGFLRWGEPLVNAFAKIAEHDDRGKAFAVELVQRAAEPDRAPLVAFCFDFKIGPGLVGVPVADQAFARAVEARAALYLPTTVERVWWLAGLGPCNRQMVQHLEHVRGENLGSRPERFRELTAPIDWNGACETAHHSALVHVRERDHVVRRLTTARRDAAAAQEREDAVLNARARTERTLEVDRRVAVALDQALANPQFVLESCGAVFITWVNRS